MEHAPTDQTKDVPAWELRFRAAVMTFPRWAREAPERLTVVTNESGAYQVYAWDRVRGTRRRLLREHDDVLLAGAQCGPAFAASVEPHAQRVLVEGDGTIEVGDSDTHGPESRLRG